MKVIANYLVALAAWFCLCLSGQLCLTGSAYCQQPLNVQANQDDGLILWLDAAALAESSKQQNEFQTDRWPDLSPANNALVQSDEESRPEVVPVGEDWIVRFDGENDFLRATSDEVFDVKQLTVFVVAAVKNNLGGFRAFIAANQQGQFDYQSGFNIDLGPGPGFKVDTLNVEGKGFPGASDLLESEWQFGQLKVIQLNIDTVVGKVSCYVDGKLEGERDCQTDSISLQELTVGARYFENGTEGQKPLGPLNGDIAEVRIYDRLLSVDRQKQVTADLLEKHKTLKQELSKRFQEEQAGVALQKVVDPPLVQMTLPGFEVFELPVELNNINNVRYRQDGKLLALGYDGDIHLLEDTDGDGLEDRAETFWKSEGRLRGPIGMAVTPENYPKGKGVFVPSKGKVSLIVDTDNDDVADQEIIVATGWPEIFTNVDAVGLCLDDDLNIYFGLGVADFSNAYQVGDDGVAKYDRNAENGTIQKVSADFSKRETICTGIRFPIGMDINQHGDLFCTEQEGATWLANGNPLDELLWIRPDRHYGFPPRHPRYNPDVIDEPSVFEYGPQHQSTCGMFFNTGVNGGPVFGDSAWKNDAIVVGESRGKIWRTTLQKTATGYLAQNQLLACLQMLTVDSCVAPNGDLIVCCHSGPPDWGTGPTGKGKLFRIRSIAADQRPARPVVAWQQSANEIRIAFDKPVDPAMFANTISDGVVHYGKFVRAGDEFENMVPPYVAVHRQLATPRFRSAIHSFGLTADRRTMILSTDRIQDAESIAVSLKTADQSQNVAEVAHQIAQQPMIQVDVQNQGWAATIVDQEGSKNTVWLPHLNMAAVTNFTNGSEPHQQWFGALTDAQRLVFSTQLDLHDMLRPAIQPGEEIDYQWPKEEVTVQLRFNGQFKLSVNGQSVATQNEGDKWVAQWTTSGETEDWQTIEVDFDLRSVEDSQLQEILGCFDVTELAETQELEAKVCYWTNEDQRQRVLPVNRFHLPWRKSSGESTELAQPVLPDAIANASWGRGRQVFQGAATCYKCHAVDSVGGVIGPDLSNLRHRDFETVQRDILKPSFMINPDYVGNTVLLDDGRTLTGIIRTIDGQQQIGSPEGKWEPLDPESVEAVKPASISVMPEKLLDELSEQEKNDLYAYLLKPAPSMPLDSPLKAPALRSKQEVAEVLAGSEVIENPRQLTITLCAGPKDHGPGEHDYPEWQKKWGQLLVAAENVDLQLAWEFPDAAQLKKSDIIVFFQKGEWNDERQNQMDDYFQRGGGAVYLHWAVNGNNRAKEFSERIGLASKAGSVGYRHGPLDLNLHHQDDPIMRNLGDKLQLYDESYWELAGDESEIQLLATSTEQGLDTPQVWTYQPGKGRVFVSIPGHYSWTFDDPIFRTLLLRGMAWTADEPVDRFNELVPLGARMQK